MSPPEHITWAGVAFTLVVSLPAIIAAYYGARNARSLKTGNAKTVGTMVTEVHGVTSEEATPFLTHGSPPNG